MIAGLPGLQLRRTPLIAVLLFLLAPSMTTAQQPTPALQCTNPTGGNPNRPFPVCEVQSVISRGPFIYAPTDTSATIVWMTDRPSHSSVRYGEDGSLDREAIPVRDGLTPVGTLHVVPLSGLRPGRTYQYRVASTPVLELNTYWPRKGRKTQSEIYSFTTFDPAATSVSFVSITDTHENPARIDSIMQRVDWETTDFLVHTGDAFDGVTSEAEVWDQWLTPLIEGGLHQSKPLIFARGNHDTRGPFARELAHYVPAEEGRFYYARDVGPVHLLAIDTGEDKADSTQVYARLNRMEAYRARELAWFKQHASTSQRLKEAPFRVIVMHQPTWGWVAGDNAAARREWTDAANSANVDLVIAGHRHRFSWMPPGDSLGNRYPMLVVGQGQFASVHATATEIRVSVIGNDGKEVAAYTVPRRDR